MERITEDHVVLFEQTQAKNREGISENQRLREELKQKDEENFANSAVAARQGQLKKARITHEISTKECPSSVILSGNPQNPGILQDNLGY